MQADELDTRARLRAHMRGVITDLHTLGVPTASMRGKNLLELEGLKLQALGQCMAAPRS